jgi:hypothetical protein
MLAVSVQSGEQNCCRTGINCQLLFEAQVGVQMKKDRIEIGLDIPSGAKAHVYFLSC